MTSIDILGAQASVRTYDVLTTGMVGATVEFRFDKSWDNLVRTAVFRQGAVTKDVVNIGTTAKIPPEVLMIPGLSVKIGVLGTNSDGTVVIPTVWAETRPVKDGTDPSGDESADPTLPVWEQILATIGDMHSLSTEAKGNLVASINELVQLCEDGTVDAEYIQQEVEKYLKENPVTETDPTVPAWAKQPEKPKYTAQEVGALPADTVIPTIPDNVSAFRNDAGYLTEHQDISGKLDASKLPEAVNTALAQAKASGEFKGDPGADGQPGKDGSDGSPGKDGTSATHSWNGTVLTVTSASGTSSADLKGAKGDTGAKGDKGDKGEQGIQGDKGDTGATGSDANVTAQNIAKALGYTPANETEVDSLSSNQSALSARMDTFTKLGEGSTTGDAELIDARVDCDGKVWNNAGGHIRGITEKIIDACCDKEIISGGNYNLLKPSECTYSSRLQNDAEAIVSSTNANVVSGWFPVTHGKYYAFSSYAEDLYRRTHLRTGVNRIQLKLADGTIKLYSIGAYPHTTVSNGKVYGVDDVNAVYMRAQIQITKSGTGQDISTPDKIKAFEPMIVEGNTPQEALNNSLNFAYLDGDVEIPGEVNYKPKLERRVEMLENWDKYLTYEAQKRIAYDWRIPFIDVFNKVGLGSKHVIPGTYDVWGGTGNDLTQKEIMMEDGIHPHTGNGVINMYAQAIIPQLRAIPPLYSADSEHEDWTGKTMLWMGTSVPAGSDPALGSEGNGTTYPAITASKLGATCTNIARGSSCVRINSSAGNYENMAYNHFLRSLSRTTAEADLAQANWDSIKANITSAASAISASDLAIMKDHSFESLLLPHLNGTHPMPDLFVIDYGHNDRRPYGVDGMQDLLVKPTVENIENGKLAEDTYMTANNYANLKTAFNNDLSKIGDIESFAASLNRNCFIGAVNFIITLIYRYNPKARIVIISDYD